MGGRDQFEDGEWKGHIGRLGEQLAGKYLRRQGMKVLYCNFRAPKGGEVDIVCRDGEVLVFAEVKTRTTLDYGRPASAVNRGKQRLITRGGLGWLRLLDFPEVNFRFDIVEVVLVEGEVPDINLIKNAFQLAEPYRY